MPSMTFGIQTPPNRSWADMSVLWKRLEDLGFASLWIPDHLVRPYNPADHSFEAWTLLTGLATVTQRARIGILVSCNTFRHPGVLAKQAITLDHISNGRLEFGLGAGWFVPEHTMYGVDFPHTGELVTRFREAVEVCDQLFRERVASYDGQFYRLADAQSVPGPMQRPRPPFTLGAHGPKMLRIVAEYADRWNTVGTVEQVQERSARLDEACHSVGRDPKEITRSLLWNAVQIPDERPWDSPDAFLDMAGRYAEVGLTEIILQPPPDPAWPTLDQVASQVLSAR